MKKLILISALVGLLSEVCAQKQPMTEKERDNVMQVLKWLHENETSDSFNALKNLKVEDASKKDVLPWDEWSEKQKDKRYDLLHLFKSFENVSVQPVDDSPNVCELVFYCKEKETEVFSGGVSGTFSTLRKLNEDNCTNLRCEVFCGLDADVELHLTDSRGKFVYFAEMIHGQHKHKTKSDGYREVWHTINLPLSVPWEDVEGGYIELKLFPPQEYDWVQVALGDAAEFPQKITLGNKKYIIEKVDSVGMVISANSYYDWHQLRNMKFLYKMESFWYYNPYYIVGVGGDVQTMLKLKYEGKISFEEWLKKKCVDPNKLEKTIGNYLSKDMYSDAEPDLWGKYINTRMYGDSLLLYMPVEPEREKTIASFRLPIPLSEKDIKTNINRPLCNKLLDQLGLSLKMVE